MDQDALTALIVFLLVFTCGTGTVLAAYVCPRTRPRRVSGYIDDEVDLV
jgi:hypothetical protein